MRVAPLLVAVGAVTLCSTVPARAAPSDVAGIETLFEMAAIADDTIPVLSFGIADAVEGHGVGYGISELAFNSLAGGAYMAVLEDAGPDDDLERGVGLVGVVVHDSLALHGLATIADHEGWPLATTLTFAGSMLSMQAFALHDGEPDGEPHHLGWRVADISLNSALGVGYTYLTIQAIETKHPGRATAAILGGFAATGFAVDAIQHVPHHPHPHLHAIARAGVGPTMVDDGREFGIGIGLHRRI